MKTFLLIVINCTLLLSLNAQNNQVIGYYGKRNYVDFSVNLNSPLLYKALNQPDSYDHKQEIKLINSGISFQVGRKLKKNIGVALNFSSFKLACYSPTNFTIPVTNDYFSGSFDPFVTKTTSFMPVFTSSYFDNAPMGLEFEAGIGRNTSRIENNGLTYYANDPFYQAYEQSILKNANLFDFNQKFHSYTIMLGLKTRFALSDKLLVNLGIRFTASTKLKNNTFEISESSNLFENRLVTAANKTRTNRIAVLGIGLTYVF